MARLFLLCSVFVTSIAIHSTHKHISFFFFIFITFKSGFSHLFIYIVRLIQYFYLLFISLLLGEWFKKLESYRSYFEEQENICSDESKRINKSDSSNAECEDLFGTTGSFHKLAIDWLLITNIICFCNLLLEFTSESMNIWKMSITYQNAFFLFFSSAE